MNDFYTEGKDYRSECYSRIFCPKISELEEKSKEIKQLKEIIRGKKYLESELKEKERIIRIKDEAMEALLERVSLILSINPVFSFLRKRIQFISGVERVYVYLRDDIYDFWFIVKEYDSEIEDRVCNFIADLLEQYVEVKFDFMVLEESSGSLEQLLPKDGIEIFP